MLKNMNKKLNGGTVTHNDIVSVGECIHMYYLFAEPYVTLDMKNFEEVKRDSSWLQMLLSVIKKSNALLGRSKLSVGRATGAIVDSTPMSGKRTRVATHLSSNATSFSQMIIFSEFCIISLSTLLFFICVMTLMILLFGLLI